MRILVAPDSFKGSESAKTIGDIIKLSIIKEISHAMVDVIPMADGGEGTVDALLHSSHGRKVNISVTGPTGKKINVFYGILEDTQTVIIEIASIVGFTSVSEGERSPYKLTTYGIGECVIHALDAGYRKFMFCLGGSATNDGGLGMLQALGASFYNKSGSPLAPYPFTFSEICFVDYGQVDRRIWESEIQVASDVKNPLCGKNGATYIFGPQKGVRSRELKIFDQEIKNFAGQIETHLDQKYQHLPGAGAAGGLGFALLTIGARIKSGAELIAKHIDLETKIKQSDWVITGEGRTDDQTLQGKLPYVIAKLARQHGIPTILISGSIEGNIYRLYDVFDSMHSIASGPLTLEYSIKNTAELLHHCAKNIARLLRYTG